MHYGHYLSCGGGLPTVGSSSRRSMASKAGKKVHCPEFNCKSSPSGHRSGLGCKSRTTSRLSYFEDLVGSSFLRIRRTASFPCRRRYGHRLPHWKQMENLSSPMQRLWWRWRRITSPFSAPSRVCLNLPVSGFLVWING